MKQKAVLTPVRRNRVRDQVFDQFQEQVIKGVWKPGEKLPSENELASSLGVSRVSIREGLQKLVTLGLLETRHGEGTFVKEITPDLYLNALFPMLVLEHTSVFHVLEYRRSMDTGAVALAVRRATEDDIAELERIMVVMKDSSADPERFAEADLDFHLAVAKAAKNPIFIKVNSIIKNTLSASMTGIVQALGPRDGLFYHRKILDAIKTGNTAEAVRLMDEHVVKTIDRLEKSRTKHP
ncbi:MAG: FadR family transcriptional regulator [Spirochaetales bacterium]|jgi:GntR family transcriptional repressor for pyruvate dehydrogenase complex|nr:FadR family transcriptional regulator [Spirochaetales bacterium]